MGKTGEFQLSKLESYSPLLLVLVGSLIFLFNLGGANLWDDDEPKNASCGREMYERGDWVVPTFNEELRSHKPILLYWAMIASYSLFGVSEFSARLPSVIASLGTVFLCFQIGRLLYDRATGFMAGLLLCSGLMFAVLSRAATPDAVLILCTTSAFYCFVFAVSKLRGGSFNSQENSSVVGFDQQQLPLWPAVGMYACMGLAVLAKGPIGVLLPMTVIGLYALTIPRKGESPSTSGLSLGQKLWSLVSSRFAPAHLLRVSTGLRCWMGAAVVIAVAMPWYIAVSFATEGEWLSGFIGTHNVHRFLHPMEGHGGPVFYYIIAILAGFFPGSCFLPVAVVKAVQDQRQAKGESTSHAFLLSWIGTYLVFFSLAATKLPNYIVPCFPALAVITGFWLVQAVRGASVPKFWLKLGISSYVLAGIAVTVGFGVVAFMFLERDLMVMLVGLAPVVGGIAALVMLHKERHTPALEAFVISGILFTILGTGISTSRVSPYQTSHRLADHLTQIKTETGNPSTEFATYGYTKPNLVFYTGGHVPGVQTVEEAVRLVNEGGYLVMPEHRFAELQKELPASVSVIHSEPKFMQPEKQIVIVGQPALMARKADPFLKNTK